MNKKFVITGAILILIGIYSFIVTVVNIPPFATDQEMYTYTVDVEEALRLPPTVILMGPVSEIVISTHNPIQNYQMYKLALKGKRWDTGNNKRVYFTLPMTFILTLTGLYLIMRGFEKKEGSK